MREKWIVLLIISVFLAAITGGVAKFLRKDNKPKVVVVLRELNSPYWNIVKVGAERGFQEFDIDGKVLLPSNKSKKGELEYILKNVLKEHPDVLVVTPNGSPAVTSILKKFV